MSDDEVRNVSRPINPGLLGLGIGLIASAPMLGMKLFIVTFVPGIMLLAAAGFFGRREMPHDRP